MALPLVLIPGMMCDARLFGPQIEAFSSTRAVQVAHVGGQDTIEAMAADVLANAPQHFALAGLSLGGIIAMEVMRQAPERIGALALLDTNPRAELPEVAAGREPQIAAVQSGQMRDLLNEKIFPLYLADGQDPEDLLPLCWEMASALGPDVFVRQSRALAARTDAQDVLATVTVPTLILMGREDRLCPLDRHERMQELIPHAHFEIIENAGHLPTLEQSTATNAALKTWLDSL